MPKINNIKIATQLPHDVEFKAADQPVFFEGRYYQLYEGEKQTPFSELISSFFKACLATFFTGFLRLDFESVRKKWQRVFHPNRTIKRYVPVPLSAEKSLLVKSPVGNVYVAPISSGTNKKEPNSLQEIVITESSQKQNEWDELLDIIRTDAQKDLFLDDNYLEKKYGIRTRIASLLEEEQKVFQAKLNHIMNTAYLQQFLRDKGKIVARENVEEFVLQYLDKRGDESSYDKEAVYSAFQEMTQTQLKPEHFTTSHASFRQLLQDYALRARLSAVKITDEAQVAKFKCALSPVRDMAKKLTDAAEEVSLTLPPSIPQEIAPLAIKKLNSIFHNAKLKVVSNKLVTVFSPKIKVLFFDSSVDVASFEKQIKERAVSIEIQAKDLVKKKCEQAKQDRTLLEEMHLYAKWGPFLKAEMIQGLENPNEVLGQGVCSAMCFRLLQELQLKPEEKVDKLAIHAVDRFKQALDIIKIKLLKAHVNKGLISAEAIPISFLIELRDENIPKEWLNNSPFQKEQKLFEIASVLEENDFNKRFTSPENLDALKQTNGWMVVSIRPMDPQEDGHMMLMRLDQDHQKAWLFDPNMGLFCFESDKKTFDQARSECLECFKNLCGVLYPDLFRLEVTQLVPK